MRDTWEYIVLDIWDMSEAQIESCLDRRGRDGWELVCGLVGRYAVMKRLADDSGSQSEAVQP